MESEKKLKLLQMFYAGALADSALRLAREGVLAKVAAEKKQEQLASGKARAAQLGIQRPVEVFEILPEVFGCANWRTEPTGEDFEASATRCMLCSFAKKLGAGCPCHIHCLDAMEGLVKGVDEAAQYEVLTTLWDQKECKVIIRTGKQ